MKLSKDVALTVEDDALVVTLQDAEKVILNETGSFVLNKIARGVSVSEVVADLCANYDVELPTALADVACFLEQLKTYGVLTGRIDLPASTDNEAAEPLDEFDDNELVQPDVETGTSDLFLIEEEVGH